MTGTTRRKWDYHALCTSLLGAMMSLAAADSARALDPLTSLDHHVRNVTQRREGRPENSILANTRWRDGYLWLGAEEPSVRSLAIRAANFDMKNTPDLRARLVRPLGENRAGNLWVGTSRGLARFRNGRIVPVCAPGPLKDAVFGLLEDDHGSRWMTGNKVASSAEAPFWMQHWFAALAILCALGLAYRLCKARHAIGYRREREKIEVIRSVTAGILHEFRQPLQVMQTRLELMQLRSEGKDDEAVADAQRVLDSLERLRLLLERVESLHNGEELRLKPYATQDKIVDLGLPTKKA